jgi:hypothetical protein
VENQRRRRDIARDQRQEKERFHCMMRRPPVPFSFTQSNQLCCAAGITRPDQPADFSLPTVIHFP